MGNIIFSLTIVVWRGDPPSRYAHPNVHNFYGCFILQLGKCFTNVIKDLDMGIILDCLVSSMQSQGYLKEGGRRIKGREK